MLPWWNGIHNALKMHRLIWIEGSTPSGSTILFKGKKYMLCEYGCGREAIYQLKNGKWCCGSSRNKCPELRRKNSEGLKRHTKKEKWMLKKYMKINHRKQSKE